MGQCTPRACSFFGIKFYHKKRVTNNIKKNLWVCMRCSCSTFLSLQIKSKNLEMYLLGYPSFQNKYKFYHPTTRRKLVFMNVTFFESVLFFLTSKTSLQGKSRIKIGLPIKLFLRMFPHLYFTLLVLSHKRRLPQKEMSYKCI